MSKNGSKGFCAIGFENIKKECNCGTLWRSAGILGASFIFTIGRRYTEQRSDTAKTWRNIPLYHYEDLDHFCKSLPRSCRLVGIEMDKKAIPIKKYSHLSRVAYMLGAEDFGLTRKAIEKCDHLISLPGETSLNVSTAGSIVLFDRLQKQ